MIADDVTYFDEPFFQDGPVAVAVNEVVAAGANYFSSAGNDNLFDAATGKDEIASWEAPAYRDTGCPAALPALAYALHELQPRGRPTTASAMTVEAGETLTVDLQWAQPWNGVTTDFDAYLVSGGKVLARSEFAQHRAVLPGAGRGARLGKPERRRENGAAGDRSLRYDLWQRPQPSPTPKRSAAPSAAIPARRG